MGDEKKSDTEKGSTKGFPKISAMHVVIAVAVIVIAVIFIAKFGFGTDMINPSSGEMAIAKRPVVTTLQTLSPRQQPGITAPTTSVAEVTTTTTQDTCGMWSYMQQKRCSGTCVEIWTDRENCGDCGIRCPDYQICKSGQCYTPDIFTDINNCGTIGNKCPASTPNSKPECVKGICTFDCNENYRFCGDPAEGCVAMYYDDNHCGNCDTKCGSGQWCNKTYCDSGPRQNVQLKPPLIPPPRPSY